MSEGKFDLSYRTLLVALIAIGVAGAAMGAGTMALFSDTEQSTDNTVQAGTLDLAIDGLNGEATTTFDVDNVAPGDNGTESSNISNEGSIAGSVNVDIGETWNDGGANPESEPGSDDGELGDNVEVTIYIEEGSTQTQVASGTLNDVANQTYETGHVLESGDEADLVVEWEIDRGVGNEIQGDVVEVDIDVELDQEE